MAYFCLTDKRYLSVVRLFPFPFVLFPDKVRTTIGAGAQLASRSQRPPRLLLKGKVGRTPGNWGTGRETGWSARGGVLEGVKREIPRLLRTADGGQSAVNGEREGQT